MRVRLVAGVVLVLSIAACGGDTSSATTSASTQPDTTAPSAATTPPAGATPFPVPIPQGGTISSEFPGEVTFEFPDTLYDQLIAFYDRFAADFTDVASGETFPDGYEWQVTDGDQIYFIQLNLEPPIAKLFIRVADN